MGNHIRLQVPTPGLVRHSGTKTTKALLTLLTVGATDEDFIADAIKSAQSIGYKVIR